MPKLVMVEVTDLLVAVNEKIERELKVGIFVDRTNTDNPFFKLIEDIRANGLYVPPTICYLDGQLTVVDGAARILAVKEIGWNRIPVQCLTDADLRDAGLRAYGVL